MIEYIKLARQNAEKIRFSADNLQPKGNEDFYQYRLIRDMLYKSGLLITKQTTPRLAAKFYEVCKNLDVPFDSVEAFVFSSPEIQAECFASSFEKCTIRFSSGLINLLDEDEFSFVAGHELGHFLLNHQLSRMGINKESAEYFMQQRAQEISGDRIGLIGCGDIQIAIRTLMKTISGLSEEFLRFDVGQFISQVSQKENLINVEEMLSTHPSTIMRCRALLWFSMDCGLEKHTKLADRKTINELDAKILTDLKKYIDGPIRKIITLAKQEFFMWLLVLEVINFGKFKKTDQNKFEDLFDKITLEKVKKLIENTKKNEVHDVVYSKVKLSREELEKLIPESFENVFKEINQQVKMVQLGRRE